MQAGFQKMKPRVGARHTMEQWARIMGKSIAELTLGTKENARLQLEDIAAVAKSRAHRENLRQTIGNAGSFRRAGNKLARRLARRIDGIRNASLCTV